MFEYLNQYCYKSTSNITFTSTNKYYRMKEPFYKAEMIRFERCSLNAKLKPLNKLFPNVRTLSFDECYVKYKHIAAHFPHLNQLKIKGNHLAFRCKPQVKILRMNPQLRCLTLDTIYDTKLLQVAGEHLQFLEHIHIFGLEFHYKHFGDKIVNFACLKELKISYCTKITKIPISSNCLKEISFVHRSWDPRLDNVDIFIEFLKKHPTVSKIRLTSDKNKMVTTNKKTLIGMIESLSSISEPL